MSQIFSLTDYMEGKPLPDQDSAKEEEYYYGVYLTYKFKYASFVCKALHKIPGPQQGQVMILTCKKESCSSQEVLERAQQDLEYYESTFPSGKKLATELNLIELEEEIPSTQDMTLTFDLGDIVVHADGFKEHTAIVLRKERYKSHLLFVTSNPRWHPGCRKMDKEEQALLGYPIKKTSYFAKVRRNNDDLVATGKTYPEHRIIALMKEFL